MRFTWRRPGDKGRAGNAGEQEAPLLETASPPLSVPSTSTLKAYSRMPLRDDMFNPNQVDACICTAFYCKNNLSRVVRAPTVRRQLS